MVVLVGPRQVGKATLALEVAQRFDPNHLYLDMGSELDQAKLASVRLFLSRQKGRLVVIDEVHRKPALFPERHLACSDLQPKRKVVTTPGQEQWWLAEDIEVIGFRDLVDSLT